jgi:hypothetical protein
MIPEQAIEAAANAISQSSGMRFDGFWSRVEDLEPEDREYALAEARAALVAAAPFIRAQALEYAAEAIDWIRPETGPGINITPYREGRNDALTSAATWLRARAVTERGGE